MRRRRLADEAGRRFPVPVKGAPAGIGGVANDALAIYFLDAAN